VPEIRPRKLPRQARSRATFDAIVEAYARLLRKHRHHEITTNQIAERAGVSIGSLYEFFPGREAILAVLTQRRLAALLRDVEAGIDEAQSLGLERALDLLLRRIVDAVSADRELYRIVLREAPFLEKLPETKRARDAFLDLARTAGRRAARRLDLPELEVDVWLIGRMLANAVLAIAFADEREVDRDVLVDELVRLTLRMVRPKA
jgi:AcrR family transcriptional regulator